MRQNFDAVVIGGGPGGYVCAAELARAGKTVALVEQDALGGTCLNRGCIPTKTLLHAADLLEALKKARGRGLTAGEAAIDRAALLARKDAVAATLRQGISQMLTAAGVTVIAGEGFVPGVGRVDVKTADGQSLALEAQDIVAAVGSSPAIPPIPGCDLPGVITSDNLLAELPGIDRLVIVGGGVIGMEFAALYAALGSQVTVLEGLPRILPALDREIGQSLGLLMKKRGVGIVTDAVVQGITRAEGRLCCAYTVKGNAAAALGDRVLIAAGRRSLAPALFAQAIAPAMEKGRVIVDAHMACSIPHIYVIGDAADGYPQLAHVASAQGLAAAAAIAGASFHTDLSLAPACVYTQPEIAAVGLTEAAAKQQGLIVKVGKYPTSASGKALITDQERGFIKLVAGEDGVLLGAQLMCARATDMVGELALAIAQKLTVAQVAALVRPHPTFEEGIGEAARLCAAKLSSD